MIERRWYQKEACLAIEKAYIDGIDKQLVVMPTGSGKTIVMAWMHEFLHGRTLIITNREELVLQVKNTFEKMHMHSMIGVEMNKHKSNPMDEVVIATPQTIGRKNSERLAETFSPFDFSQVYIDEAHHEPASTYKRILEYFQPELVLGFTATPFRSDDKRLDFQITYEIQMKTLVPKYLCDLRPYKINTGIDLAKVKIEKGDFKTRDLSEKLDVRDRNYLCLQAWENLAEDRKTIIFAIDIEHAMHLEDIFQQNGHKAKNISGLKMQDRRQVLEDFHYGHINPIINCNILTEGFDDPAIECIIMARPTLSHTLYSQMIGRGTRVLPMKQSCIIIDIVDNAEKNFPVAIPALFGLAPYFDCQGMKVKTEVIPVVERLSKQYRRKLWECRSMEHIGEVIAKLKRTQENMGNVARIVKVNTTFNWVPVEDKWVCALMDREWVKIDRRDEMWYATMKETNGRKFWYTPIGKHPKLETVVKEAEHYIKHHRRDHVVHISRYAKWRSLEPSKAQIDTLAQFGISAGRIKSRGHADELLTQALWKE